MNFDIFYLVFATFLSIFNKWIYCLFYFHSASFLLKGQRAAATLCKVGSSGHTYRFHLVGFRRVMSHVLSDFLSRVPVAMFSRPSIWLFYAVNLRMGLLNGVFNYEKGFLGFAYLVMFLRPKFLACIWVVALLYSWCCFCQAAVDWWIFRMFRNVGPVHKRLLSWIGVQAGSCQRCTLRWRKPVPTSCEAGVKLTLSGLFPDFITYVPRLVVVTYHHYLLHLHHHVRCWFSTWKKGSELCSYYSCLRFWCRYSFVRACFVCWDHFIG